MGDRNQAQLLNAESDKAALKKKEKSLESELDLARKDLPKLQEKVVQAKKRLGELQDRGRKQAAALIERSRQEALSKLKLAEKDLADFESEKPKRVAEEQQLRGRIADSRQQARDLERERAELAFTIVRRMDSLPALSKLAK